MKARVSRGMCSAFLCLALLLAATPGAGAEPAPDVEQGHALYLRYCGSCHGAMGDGNGPVGSVLKVRPTNLRKLGERYGRPLPESVLRSIDGREQVAAHGDRTMPVWGRSFILILEEPDQPLPSESEVRAALQSILLYLDSIQPGGENAPKSAVR
jgi:mono/diheme cytochrome c family protein